MVTLRQIEAFKAVMDNGMVLNAARAMHLSQPAVSRLLADLEADLGYRLFDRRKGRLVPRGEAEELYASVERSFSGLRHIEREASRIGRRAANQLRIAALPALSVWPVPVAVREFLSRHPAAHISIQTRSRRRVLEAVVDRRYDLGLTTLPVAHPDVRCAPVARLRFHCITHANHPLAGLQVVTPDDLDGVDMVALAGETSRGLRHCTEQIFRDAGVVPVIRAECSAVSVACALAAEGVGVLLVPPLCIGEELRPLVRIIPFTPEITMEIAVLRPADQAVGELAAGFIDTFRDVLRQARTGPRLTALA